MGQLPRLLNASSIQAKQVAHGCIVLRSGSMGTPIISSDCSCPGHVTIWVGVSLVGVIYKLKSREAMI